MAFCVRFRRIASLGSMSRFRSQFGSLGTTLNASVSAARTRASSFSSVSYTHLTLPTKA